MVCKSFFIGKINERCSATLVMEVLLLDLIVCIR